MTGKLNQNKKPFLFIKRIRAFTLVEILISVALLGIFLLGVGTFFLQGNKAAAKGTWRIQTTARLRSGMKLLQRALDATAYPAYTGPNQFQEMFPWDTGADVYDLKFYKAFSSDATEPVSFVAGEIEGPILEFTTITPHQLHDDGSVAAQGQTTYYTISFPLEADRPARVVIDGNDGGKETPIQELVILGEEGSHDYTGGGAPTITPTGKTSRVSIPDVHKVTVSVFQKFPNPEYSNNATHKPEDFPRVTLNIEIECRDPFDARLKVVQNLIYRINTQITSTGGGP